MRNRLGLALFGATALASTAALAQAPHPANAPQTQATLADCDRLVTVLEQRKPANAGITVEQVRTFRTSNNAQGCRDALVRIDPALANQTAQSDQPARPGEAARIVVQQPAPAIQVQQASPQVTVQQPQAQVTVRQAQPEILVRQPQPTVTVDIPQPEIILRMPRPEVNVAQAQPQVEVRQAQPQVVVQPQQAQPNVQVQGANTQPNVQVQGADQQPVVRYERSEAKVVVNQPQGQPNVRVEHQADRAGAPGTQQRVANQTGSLNAGALTVARVNSLNLYSRENENLGDVERVVQGQDGKQYLIIGSGGFLGLGEKRVAIPAERVAVNGDRLVVQGITNDQIKAMPTFDRNDRSYRELDANQAVQISSAR